MAIRTSIDFTIANSLRARRRLSEPAADEKLAVLRRLTKQYVSGVLPRFTETSVEQSWNEQVFAKVLGYQTQFSHDRLPFHLKAKDFRGGYFADFSLGFFGAGTERILASAELKGPETSLDAAQAGKSYGGLTPVEQAFRAAKEQPDCLWVLVSNFSELRLYSANASQAPVATIFLPDVADALDLALVQGLLDRRALLGDTDHAPELVTMTQMTFDHPGAPVAPKAREYRLIVRFTPRGNNELPLFKAEQSLLTAISQAPAWFRILQRPDYGLPLALRSRLADGWVAVDGYNNANTITSRIAVSLLGQVQASFRFASGQVHHDQTLRESVDFGWLVTALRFFGGVVEGIYPMQSKRGLFGAELREVKEKYLNIHNSLVAPHGYNWGVAEIDDVLAGDFIWKGSTDTLTRMVATCACELAAHFRTPNGGAAANLAAVEADIDAMNAKDKALHP